VHFSFFLLRSPVLTAFFLPSRFLPLEFPRGLLFFPRLAPFQCLGTPRALTVIALFFFLWQKLQESLFYFFLLLPSSRAVAFSPEVADTFPDASDLALPLPPPLSEVFLGSSLVSLTGFPLFFVSRAIRDWSSFQLRYGYRPPPPFPSEP